MDKMQIGKNFFIPMPVVLVGTLVSGKANFMTVGWCSRANASPPMILCGIANHHHTPKGIAETKTFSVNIPSSDLLEIDPLFLTMPDNRYWTLGKYVGDAWSAGKNLIQSKEATTKDGI